jgi:D-arabinose 1-dehydrogenase-like Zn-dependent alcohol dehydrogenase
MNPTCERSEVEARHVSLDSTMLAMSLRTPGTPLEPMDRPTPVPGPGQVVIRVLACGVCRTDLHLVDGELPNPRLPVVPGHEVVGTVIARGDRADRFTIGDRVGVPWLGWACGECRYCRAGRENLCDRPGFTGYTLDGGYAEALVADERFCLPIPPAYSDAEAAPLLCAGLIGYRSLVAAGDARSGRGGTTTAGMKGAVNEYNPPQLASAIDPYCKHSPVVQKRDFSPGTPRCLRPERRS